MQGVQGSWRLLAAQQRDGAATQEAHILAGWSAGPRELWLKPVDNVSSVGSS